MKKTSLLLLFLLACCYAVFAQLPNRKVFDIKTMLPTSPDAAMLGRFGDIPIGYYTGTADISISVDTIKEAGLEIPIILKYHSSGIKVQDEAGWVGLGWSLEPAGSIIQTVIGREDGLDNLVDYGIDGYNYMKENMLLGSYSEKLASSNNPQQGVMRAFGFGEGQPDYYYFNFPGGSGKFYINPENGDIVVIDKKTSLSIVKNSSESWTITTLDGNKFFFTVKETASGYSVLDISGYTWKLSKIQLHNGREINFDYSNGYYNSFSHNASWHDDYPLGYGDGGIKAFTNGTIHNIKYLKSINAPNLTINFVLEDRDDLYYSTDDDGIPDNGSLSTKRLKSILIKEPNSNKLIRSFDFDYGYFSYSLVGGNFMNINNPADYDKLGKRLKLTSIRENGYDDLGQIQPSKPYTFTYDESIQLPLKTSYARDFWGYYNGKNNTSLLPNLSYYLFSGYPEYQGIPQYVLSSYGNGANRSVNVNTIQAGILKKITYPTGGYSTFDYETNNFTNYNYPDVDQISGSTVSNSVEDKNNTNDVYSRQFTIPNSLTAHFVVSINRGPNTSLTFADLLPSTVTLTRIGSGGSNITPIKTWQMASTQAYGQDFAADGIVTWTEDLALEYVPNTYYVLIASLPNSLGPQNSSTNSASVSAQYSFSYMINTTSKLSNGAGLRIKSIKDYSDENVLASHKNIEYKENGVSSGILMAPLKHFFKRKMFFQKVTQTGLGCTVDTANINIWFVSSDSYIPFSDAAQGNAVGYGKVQEIEYANNITNGVHNYYYYNTESNTKINNPEIPNLRNGQLYKEDVLTSTADTVKKIQYSYIEKEAKFFRGFKVFENYVGYNPADEALACNLFPFGGRFSINSYPNTAQWFVLDKKIITDYFNGNRLKDTEEYSYNSLGQLSSTKTWNSKEKEVITYNKYPIDEMEPSPEVSVMVYLSLHNDILETRTTVDGNEVLKVKNHYKIYNGLPNNGTQVVLESTESSSDGADFKEEVKFVKYGDFKAPTMILKDGVYTVLLWSFNSIYPIAKIENATLEIVEGIIGAQNLIDFARTPNPTATQINTFLAPLRTSPSLKDAFITSYTYDSQIGITSLTDTKGMVTYYEYDNLRRLKNIKDQNGNIVKNFCYNYAGQLTNCNQ